MTPFTPEQYALASRLFRESVEAHTNLDDNLAEIRATFVKKVEADIGRGEFIVETSRLIAEHMWANVNNRAGVATKQMLNEIVRGQTSLALDDWLDQVITCGQHRRITRRYMVPRDWERIIAVREENVDKASHVLQEARDAAAIMRPAMLSHAGDMVAAMLSVGLAFKAAS